VFCLNIIQYTCNPYQTNICGNQGPEISTQSSRICWGCNGLLYCYGCWVDVGLSDGSVGGWLMWLVLGWLMLGLDCFVFVVHLIIIVVRSRLIDLKCLSMMLMIGVIVQHLVIIVVILYCFYRNLSFLLCLFGFVVPSIYLYLIQRYNIVIRLSNYH